MTEKNNNPGPADAGPFLIRRAAPRPKTMPDHPKCPRPPIGAKPEEPPPDIRQVWSDPNTAEVMHVTDTG